MCVKWGYKMYAAEMKQKVMQLQAYTQSIQLKHNSFETTQKPHYLGSILLCYCKVAVAWPYGCSGSLIRPVLGVYPG